MKKHLTVLICNDMRGPSDPVDNYDHVMGECLEESPLCTMGEDHE